MTHSLTMVILWMTSSIYHVVTPCPQQCSCDDVHLSVSCDRASLNVVPYTLNPRLQRLSVVNNEINNILYSFSFYKNLLFLDLTHNNISTIVPETFDNQNELRSLNLSHNVIGKVDRDNFRGTDFLLELKLNGNRIVELTPAIFVSLIRLEILDLSDNQISNVDKFAFKNLRSLRTLSLSNNNLSFIPTESFEQVSNLWTLDMCCNPIQAIQKDAFRPMKQLRYLYLDACAIMSVDNQAFTGIKQLSLLHLHDNPTPRFTTTALIELPKLKELTIGRIEEVTSFYSYAFSTVPSLRRIRVVNAPKLEYLDLRAFANNSYIESIAFVDNKRLSRISTTGSNSLRFGRLRHVSFRGNALSTLEEDVLPWYHLHSLDLRDNKFVCNCSLLWLKHLLISRINKTNGQQYSTPMFIHPVKCLRKERQVVSMLTDVSDSDLDCNSSTTHQLIILTVLSTVICVIVIIFIIVVVRYRHFIKSKLGTPQKEAYIEPRRPIMADTMNIMYDTCRPSPTRHIPVRV